jgi:hypothetical protein
MYKIDLCDVFWNNTCIFTAPEPVSTALHHKDNLIIFYEAPVRHMDIDSERRNILSLTPNGMIAWRLENPSEWSIGSRTTSYTALWINKENGKYVGHDGENQNYFDPDTGEIYDRIFTK